MNITLPLEKGQIWGYNDPDETQMLEQITAKNKHSALIYPTRPFLIWQNSKSLFQYSIYGIPLTHSNNWAWSYQVVMPRPTATGTKFIDVGYARLDQLRPIDPRRLGKCIGTMSNQSIKDIEDAMDYIMGKSSERPQWMDDRCYPNGLPMPVNMTIASVEEVITEFQPTGKHVYIDWEALSHEELTMIAHGPERDIKDLFGVGATWYYRNRAKKMLSEIGDDWKPLYFNELRPEIERNPRRVACIGVVSLVNDYGCSPEVAKYIVHKAKDCHRARSISR